MSVTEIRGITDVAQGVAGDLEAVEGFIGMVRNTAVSDGTRVVTDMQVHCPSQEAVDSAAEQWGLAAGWNEDRTQYLAVHGDWRGKLVFAWIPLKASAPPQDQAWPPAATVTRHPCGSEDAVREAAAEWTAEGRDVHSGWEGGEQYAARTVDAAGNVECAFWRLIPGTGDAA